MCEPPPPLNTLQDKASVKKKHICRFALLASLVAVLGVVVLVRFQPERLTWVHGGAGEVGLLHRGSLGKSADPLTEEYVRELRKYYGKGINKKSTQASLSSLRNFLMAANGRQGQEYFASLIMRAFPEHAKQIMDTIARLDEYERWLEANRKMLLAMSPEARMEMMWRKRTELFGEEAKEIWSGEMLASEARTAKVRETLETLNEARDVPLEDRLEIYQGMLRQTYGNTPEAFVLEQKDFLAKVFFSIDSVQEELKGLDPASRQVEINAIRRKMGFSEEEIASMERRDADRELRWQIGLAYMKEREELARQYHGEELEEKLRELRTRYFDDEAQTIELEEKDGFFRFKRPRIYGRN